MSASARTPPAVELAGCLIDEDLLTARSDERIMLGRGRQPSHAKDKKRQMTMVWGAPAGFAVDWDWQRRLAIMGETARSRWGTLRMGTCHEEGEDMAAQAVTLEVAERITAAARKKAAELSVAMNIAVVDAGSNLVSFARMDGAWLGSIDIALGKAYTARAFDMPTKDLAEKAQPEQPLFGIEATNPGRIVIFPGGIPLWGDGAVVGAVGVSGGMVDQDQAVAEAGVRAFSSGS